MAGYGEGAGSPHAPMEPATLPASKCVHQLGRSPDPKEFRISLRGHTDQITGHWLIHYQPLAVPQNLEVTVPSPESCFRLSGDQTPPCSCLEAQPSATH